MNFRLSRLLLLCISLLMSTYVWSQKDYTVVLPKESPLIEGHLKQGTHLSPSGHSFSLNNLYYLKDGQPWYPVMGEIHYGRVPRADWEESILKMKASGVTVIATYVFWNYHEERRIRIFGKVIRICVIFWNYVISMACMCGCESDRGVMVRFVTVVFPIG